MPSPKLRVFCPQILPYSPLFFLPLRARELEATINPQTNWLAFLKNLKSEKFFMKNLPKVKNQQCIAKATETCAIFGTKKTIFGGGGEG